MSMSNINQTISDTMKFLQQYQANPQSIQGTTTPSTTTANTQMQQLMPMIMMMMFQMMSKMIGQAQSPLTQDPFAGLPTTPQYFNPSPTPPQGAGQQIQNNPAYQFLNTQLTGANGATPDFTDNASLSASMNTLLASSATPNLQNLSSQLGTLNPEDPATANLKTEAQTAMQQEGRSDADISKFGLLYDSIQNNNQLAEAQAEAAALPNTNPLKVQTLTQNQTQEAAQWQVNQPVTTTTTNTQDLTQQVQAGLAAGQFTPVQLGQSLKYLMAHAPENSLGALSTLTTSLTKSGDLNIIPFLQSNYLDNLSPTRQSALLSSVENAGLTLNSGKPNSRLAGFMLEHLSRPETLGTSTDSLIQQVLQNAWQNQGQNTSTAESKALTNLLDLAGIQHTPGQPLS